MFESYLKPPISFPTLTGSIVTFNSQYAGLPLKSHTVNIDSVSGVSAINISATGKNFFNKNAVTLGKWIRETGAEHNSQNGAYSDYIPIVTNTPYYFSHIVGIGTFFSIAIYDENKTFIETLNIQGGRDSSGTITFTQGSYIRVNMYQTYLDIVQVEIGDTATAFEPFGTYTTINIGQTVNEATYNARTGVLEVTQPSVQTLQLPPCPIDTIANSVNNIWADTGDTTLQYPKFG